MWQCDDWMERTETTECDSMQYAEVIQGRCTSYSIPLETTTYLWYTGGTATFRSFITAARIDAAAARKRTCCCCTHRHPRRRRRRISHWIQYPYPIETSTTSACDCQHVDAPRARALFGGLCLDRHLATHSPLTAQPHDYRNDQNRPSRTYTMGPRPNNLNLREGGGQNNDAFERQPKMPFTRDLPSPRAGEIPPAMSPLDAFAWQSRMMAKKFQEEQEKGRRVSRLDPKLVEREIRGRPGFMRSQSDQSRMSNVAEIEEDDSMSPQSATATLPPLQTQDGQRPTSHYPMFDRASMLTEDGASQVPGVSTPFYDAPEETHGEPHAGTTKEVEDYFGIRRATSPEAVEPNVNVQAPSPNVPPSLTSSIDTISSHPRTKTNGSQRSQRSQASERGHAGLAPPQSPRFPRNTRSFQSIRSVPPDSGDEDGASTTGSQSQGLQSSRKFSGSSGVSRPQSPFSPWMQPVHRSPSMTSEYSINGSQQFQRPPQAFSHNFSRPMSSHGGRPSFEARTSFDSRTSMERRPEPPRRQASGNSSSTEASFRPAMSRGSSGDDVKTTTLQTSFNKMDIANMPTTPNLSAPPGELFGDGAITPSGASNSSYIYAKYSLPRGRPVDRDSNAFRDSWIQKQFEWDREHGHSRHDSSNIYGHERNKSDSPLFDASASPALSEPRAGRSLAVESSSSRSKSADPRAADKGAGKTPLSTMHRSSPSVKTTSTDQTIKPSPLHKKSPSAELTAEEHLEIGIEAHDTGATNKSTYHLRLAAMAGLPTAMLLYALACRHGWGMRPNQAEGVKWLRKAIDTAGLDVADAEEKLNTGPGKAKLDPLERKKRKAQYALAIYELGISSMNGWGCVKDKPLAVRCYEIAGSWGDADATAEAAFCYTQGVGVKKDLHKAAALYRKAADMGMSMAGNSW